MKLSDYPILSSPSSNALVPVLDGGANYTYPLSSLGSEGGYTFTLANDAASLPIPLLNKGKQYQLIVDGVPSVEINALLAINGGGAASQYETRYHFAFSGGVDTGYNSGLSGLALFAPPSEFPFLFTGTFSLLNQLRFSGIVQRVESPGNPRPATTTRTGRCITALSTISGSQAQLTLTMASGVFRAGTQLKIKEV